MFASFLGKSFRNLNSLIDTISFFQFVYDQTCYQKNCVPVSELFLERTLHSEKLLSVRPMGFDPPSEVANHTGYACLRLNNWGPVIWLRLRSRLARLFLVGSAI